MLSSVRRHDPIPNLRPSRAATLLVAAAIVANVSGCSVVGTPPGAEFAGPPQGEVAPPLVEPAVYDALATIVPRSKPHRRATAVAKVVEPKLVIEGFIWPVQGRVVQPFGDRADGSRSDGLDIVAEEGSPVRAAQAGVVSYAGSGIPGYGNMLLLTHPGGLVTVYAHNDRLLVGTGDTVYRGQPIASVGRSGGAAVAELHFQLRAGERPIDPTPHLERGELQVASMGPEPAPRPAAE